LKTVLPQGAKIGIPQPQISIKMPVDSPQQVELNNIKKESEQKLDIQSETTLPWESVPDTITQKESKDSVASVESNDPRLGHGEYTSITIDISITKPHICREIVITNEFVEELVTKSATSDGDEGVSKAKNFLNSLMSPAKWFVNLFRKKKK
jgi:hypothetical protein